MDQEKTNMIRTARRIRCVKKKPSFILKAPTWEAFKKEVLTQYNNYNVTFTGIKARVMPFSPFRIKITWEKTKPQLQ